MTVICRNCGEEWPRDPALEVKCPTCRAEVGSPCKRPSGHYNFGNEPHASRDRLAMECGYLRRCEGAAPQGGAQLEFGWGTKDV